MLSEERSLVNTEPNMPLDCRLPESIAKMYSLAEQFSRSRLIPKHFQDKPEDILIALQLAHALGITNYVVALSEITPINGKPTISSKLAVSLAHQSGVFKDRISFSQKGDNVTDLRVFATATMKRTGEKVWAEASMKMAIEEGWTKNPKYKSMPLHMLRYRAARFLINQYCPEVLMGIHLVEEVQDIEFSEEGVKNREVSQLNQEIAGNMVS